MSDDKPNYSKRRFFNIIAFTAFFSFLAKFVLSYFVSSIASANAASSNKTLTLNNQPMKNNAHSSPTTNTITLIGTARKISKKDVNFLCSFIKDNFYIDCFAPNRLINTDEPMFINDDLTRALVTIEAINDSSSKFIWNVNGGYGAYRIMPHLFKHVRRNTNKIIIGYSDATSIHAMLSNDKFAMPSIHWENAFNIKQKIELKTLNKDAVKIFTDIISGTIKVLSYTGLKPLNIAAYNNNVVYGKVTGGNMAIIQSAIATLWAVDCKDKILFLEDVGESFYKIDRMLQSFVYKSMFNNAKAVIIGELINTKSGYPVDYIDIVLDDFAKLLPIPVYRISNIGHECDNYPLVFMKDAEIKGGEDAKISIDLSGLV
ncbi:muramoyltetrapeptide carboxypeptidase [Candidatus Xenohaliotis californiensis]|uniref:Muramoyltetrapeptide carboxypeptidase n=1 Tax=Candidatus Xenohaliotis californiensis TaxID=84677 RepID=A0ABM9N7P4_9RICK|nr:muramoyltetrapeptide carboxypeptidase [Candidatus Xenohaliotis californiensis]